MAIMLEDFTIEEQRFIVCFLCAKELSAKDIHKETYPVYGQKCLSRKTVDDWVANIFLIAKGFKWRCGSG
jgi:hypothetical protein